MKHSLLLITIGLVNIAAAPAWASEVIDERLAAYQSEGAGDFSAERGKAMWTREHLHPKADKPRSCATCHTTSPLKVGKHVRTGKRIEPLAPSVNPERLTSKKDIEKWFTRNCKWTVGRACTPQEKGDILSYLRGL